MSHSHFVLCVMVAHEILFDIWGSGKRVSGAKKMAAEDLNLVTLQVVGGLEKGFFSTTIF